jgi:O2-independent ubiquinone biosynthesis accessory factor UbiT
MLNTPSIEAPSASGRAERAEATGESGFRLRLPAPPAALRQVVARLPWQPPSMVLALALQRWLWPRLDESQREELADAVVAVEVSDLGLQARLWIHQGHFTVAPSGAAPRIRFKASAQAFWALMQGQEDPDRLFFERKMVIEGDTEYGLLLKNTLDAVGPFGPWQKS